MGLIYNSLERGEDHAASADLLCIRFNIGPRELRKSIEEERLAGSPILSSPAGYYKPREGEDGKRDIDRCCAMLRSRANKTMNIVKRIREAGEKRGQ